MIKNITRISIIISAILLFVQCSGQNNESLVESINIDIDKSVLVNEADLIKSIRILPVEEDSLAHFQWIKKIQESDDDYLILNGTSSGEQIVKLNSEGQIMGVLSKNGGGPGEYVNMVDFDIDHVNQDIWIVDSGKKAFHIYTQDFAFKETRTFRLDTIQEVLMCFAPWSSDEIVIQRNTNLFFEGNNFKIALADREGGLLKKYMPYDEPIVGGGGSHFRLQRFGEYIDYLPRFSDEIYRIEKDSCYKKYEIVFDKPVIAVGTRNPSFDLMGQVFNQSFYESSNMIMIKFIYNQEVYESYYSKKDKIVSTLKIYQKQIDQEFMGLNKNVIGFLNEQLVYSSTGLEIQNVIKELDPEGEKISNRDIITSEKGKDDGITYLLFAGF